MAILISPLDPSQLNIGQKGCNQKINYIILDLFNSKETCLFWFEVYIYNFLDC